MTVHARNLAAAVCQTEKVLDGTFQVTNVQETLIDCDVKDLAGAYEPDGRWGVSRS